MSFMVTKSGLEENLLWMSGDLKSRFVISRLPGRESPTVMFAVQRRLRRDPPADGASQAEEEPNRLPLGRKTGRPPEKEVYEEEGACEEATAGEEEVAGAKEIACIEGPSLISFERSVHAR
ncbi:MAG: hypothetical protein ACYC6Z_10855 [Thermoleophilia bacterium]